MPAATRCASWGARPMVRPWRGWSLGAAARRRAARLHTGDKVRQLARQRIGPGPIAIELLRLQKATKQIDLERRNGLGWQPAHVEVAAQRFGGLHQRELAARKVHAGIAFRAP